VIPVKKQTKRTIDNKGIETLMRRFQPQRHLVSLIQTNKQINKLTIQSNKIKLGKAKKKSVMMEKIMVLTSSLDFLIVNSFYFKKKHLL